MLQLLLNKKLKHRKEILAVLIIFSLLLMTTQTHSAVFGGDSDIGGGDGDDGGDDDGETCSPSYGPSWSYHYDYEYEIKPTIKVTITDEKYKVLTPKGEWEPLEFSFFIETRIVDNVIKGH